MLRKAPSNKGKQEGVQWETKGDQTLGKADTTSNKGNQEGVYHWRQGETRPLRRRTHHPTKGIKKGYTIGDKGRQDPREGGHTIQQRESRRGIPETRGDKTLEKADTPSNKGKQWETKGDQTLGKTDTPSNKGKQEGRQGKTKRNKTLRPSQRRTHHPTKVLNKKGDKGRQGETRPSGRRTHHPTRGNNGRQRETRPSGRRTHHPTKGIKKGYTIGDKGRQDPREGGHTIQQRESRRVYHWRQGETRPSGRRTHHPTKGNKKGDKGRESETRPSDPRKGGHTIQRRY